MSDYSEVLPDGFGAPYVWLKTVEDKDMVTTDLYGNEINLNQLITSFEYKYDEENDDTSTIKFHMPHIEQMNHFLFREDQQLKVQWGYLRPGGNHLKGATRTIAVRDIDSNYKSDGIDIEITCTDLISYLKNARLNRTSSSNNFEDWLREIVSGEYIPSVTIQGKTTILKTDAKAESYKNIAGITNLHAVYEEDKIYWGKSKAITAEIEERLGQSTKGPLYIDGRDNVLDIKDRNFNQAPYKYYTYMGGSGELIEFRAKSNILTSRDGEAEEAILDKVDKKVKKTKSATDAGYDTGKEPEKKELWDKDQATVERVNNNAIVAGLKKQFEKAIENPTDQPLVDSIGFKTSIRYGGGMTSPVNRDGNTSVYMPKYTVEYIEKLPAKQVLNSPHILRARRLAILNNYILKKVERKYEANVKTLGDPSIISSKVYNFRNLSDRDKGDWYCVSVTHSITPGSGYTNMMEVIKKPSRLANLLERREEAIDPEAGAEYQMEVSYEENTKVMDIFPETGNSIYLNADDITRRVNEQVAFAETYYTNDIPVTKYETGENISMNTINSKDA
jgi:hypothetical protein